VFLDEFDGTTSEFQDSLRNLMETFSQSTRFILTCNYINQITDAIQSRCTTFQFQQLPKSKVLVESLRILEAEKISFQEDAVFTLVEDYYPDIRKIVNALQQHSKDGKFSYSEVDSLQNVFQKVSDFIKSGDYTKIMNLLASMPIDYTTVYKCLFDNADFYFKDLNIPAIRLEIFDSMYKSKFVADPVVNFLAFTIRCMRLCNISDQRIK
jgi:DNA polymerase III delta prime subunit